MDDLYASILQKQNFARPSTRAIQNGSLPYSIQRSFICWTESLPANGTDAANSIRAQFRELTAHYYVQLVPVIIEIRIHDSFAWDYGWHTWRKTSRGGDSQVTVKDRYVNVWRKNEGGEWRLWMYMSNGLPSQMPTD